MLYNTYVCIGWSTGRVTNRYKMKKNTILVANTTLQYICTHTHAHTHTHMHTHTHTHTHAHTHTHTHHTHTHLVLLVKTLQPLHHFLEGKPVLPQFLVLSPQCFADHFILCKLCTGMLNNVSYRTAIMGVTTEWLKCLTRCTRGWLVIWFQHFHGSQGLDPATDIPFICFLRLPASL